MYSLCILDDEDVAEEEVQQGSEMDPDNFTPQISINALEGTSGFQTLRVTSKVEKSPLFIMIDSGSTHNFINTQVAKKLSCTLTPIRPLAVEAAIGGQMTCTHVCKNFLWKMQGVKFFTDVFVVELNNCDMVLGVQWLATLGNILSNYNDLWMSFIWQGQDILLQGDTPVKLQTIGFEQFNSLINNPNKLVEVNLCSLRVIEDSDHFISSMTTTLQPSLGNNATIDELLHSYQDIFKKPTGLPPLRAHDHAIPLKEGSQPINLRPYRHTGLQKDIVEKIVTEMLDSGIIQHNTSPFASPVVLVKKKDDTWRLCVDYRALNKMTIKDKFPIPIVEELLEELGRATVFFKVDLWAGYHQIRMLAGDIRKTAFRTHNGHYEFLIMQFGLTNAPATFQSLMNDIFRRHLRKFILVFFDDILVYSPTLEKHVEQLQIVFEILRSRSLLAKRSKCVLGSSQVEYLGHVITKSGVATDPLKIQAIVN